MNRDDLKLEVHAIGSLGVNCSLIYSESSKKALLIDPGNDANAIKEIISSKGLSVVKFIHTHAHFDHIGDTAILKKEMDAELSLHSGDLSLYKEVASQGSMFGLSVSEPAAVDWIFEEGDKFKLTESDLDPLLESFEIIHTPGHTQGSASLYTEFFGTPILFAGDTLFKQSIGRTDLPGGDYDTIISSIKNKLFKLPDDTLVITGHGPTTTIGEEKRLNPFVR